MPRMLESSSRLRRIILVVIGLSWGLNSFAWSLAAEPSALAQKAKAILSGKCYSCHGEAGSADGGINFVLDRERLVKRRKLVPGKSGDSTVYRLVKEGTMPKGGVPLTEDELATLKTWIDRGAPDFNAEVKPRPFISPADVMAFIREDLRQLEAADPDQLQFVRYFSITHLYNAGLSSDELHSYRVATSKLVNSLSWKKRIVVAQAIDPAQTILRIRLGDYRWSQKTWERLVKEYPYDVRSMLPANQFCYSATHTKVPCVRADWFVATAALPPLYHEILELPESVRELEKLLRIDSEQNIAAGEVVRLAFNGSGVSTHNRLIERHECDLTGGAYWKSYDFSGDNASRNLFAHPLGPGGTRGFKHDGGELLFNLPNGLQAYLLVDAQGRRIDKGPIDVVGDPRRPDKQVVNGLSCMSCHAEGVKRKKDEVREAVLANPRSFTDAEVAQVKRLYKTNQTLETLFETDAKRFAAAVARTGGKITGDEPIVMLAMRFEEELDVDLAAVEVGFTAEQFQAGLKKSPFLSRRLPSLAVAGGTVKRDLFAEMFPVILRDLRLGQFADPNSPEIAPPKEIPDTPTPKPPSPKPVVSTKPAVPTPPLKTSVKVSTAPLTLAGLNGALGELSRDTQAISAEHLKFRQKLIEKCIAQFRNLQATYTAAKELEAAASIGAVADQLEKEKLSGNVSTARQLPRDAGMVWDALIVDLQADEKQAASEDSQYKEDFARRLEQVVVAALTAGELQQTRRALEVFSSLRGTPIQPRSPHRNSRSQDLPEEIRKFVAPFIDKAEQRLAKTRNGELSLRTTLFGKLKMQTNRDATQAAALRETIEFLEADYSDGFRLLQIFRPNRKIPAESLTLVKEFITATGALNATLVNEHATDWKTLNEQVVTVRKSLIKDRKLEQALIVLEGTPDMQRSIAPISVIGAIGRAPYLAFNTEAEILETKEGKYLLRFRRDVRGPEWVTRDQFYVGGGSGDSDQALESVARFSHGIQSTIPQGTPPGEPVTRNTKLKMGGAVYFQGGLGWENATILELTPRGARVHIDRHPSDGWDNVVDRALLRVPAK